ncbi:CYTH domain-containing protein [Aquimarina sp. AD10]|uniref:Adenylate cyclase n=1 Tax=Aquimarina aggregata TaxID=1642818 RepID=A0A162WQZ2_9FLAO|nr:MULTISPECIES: CYTH domain-containing protein [Aquimarina]AXT61508.1 CYTH domain-containing protein [Aquimarina sp. AD10]KZS38254.1 adenylate cyclase [Aquimarina aggregata]RKM89992.1 CYTH domain-containing protein [Aquimarina sp. AD10]
MIEIERKFLVSSEAFKKVSKTSTRIVQGYLNSNPERAVRVRIKGEKGFLTVKGKSNNTGTSRYEWEKEINVVEAEQLLALCEKGKIEKIRYEIPSGNHIFEVDVFSGENQGLILAEIELNQEDEPFLKPDWLGKEVTGDIRYFNSNLVKNPFRFW